MERDLSRDPTLAAAFSGAEWTTPPPLRKRWYVAPALIAAVVLGLVLIPIGGGRGRTCAPTNQAAAAAPVGHGRLCH